jgi:predicted dehydrogenase
MNNNDQLNVGIVGCGHQGGWIARAIERTEALCVTSCVDPVREAAEKLAAFCGHSNAYASVEELLRNGGVDAVIVATPHDALYGVSLSAINAGVHMLAEKPIALNGREAIEIEGAVEKAGICYMSGYSFRFAAALKQVHDLLSAGAIGRIQAVAANIGTRPKLSGWISSPETGGGALLYLGSHLVDEILWFLKDDPVEVYADVRHRADTRADDTSAFQIRFAGGAVAQCITTQASASFFNNVDIIGSDGRLSLWGAGFLSYDILVSSAKLEAYSQPTMIKPRVIGDPILAMLVAELDEFAAAVQEDRQPLITATDGRRVLEVLDAVAESGRIGKPVELKV